jgi:hypothetical protein
MVPDRYSSARSRNVGAGETKTRTVAMSANTPRIEASQLKDKTSQRKKPLIARKAATQFEQQPGTFHREN